MNPILAMTLYGVNMECIDVNDVNEKGNHIGLQWAIYVATDVKGPLKPLKLYF